jgi:hypothetical protein
MTALIDTNTSSLVDAYRILQECHIKINEEQLPPAAWVTLIHAKTYLNGQIAASLKAEQ